MFYPLYQYPYLYLCIIGLFLHIIKEFSKPCSTQPNLHILCWLSLSLSLLFILKLGNIAARYDFEFWDLYFVLRIGRFHLNWDISSAFLFLQKKKSKSCAFLWYKSHGRVGFLALHYSWIHWINYILPYIWYSLVCLFMLKLSILA